MVAWAPVPNARPGSITTSIRSAPSAPVPAAASASQEGRTTSQSPTMHGFVEVAPAVGPVVGDLGRLDLDQAVAGGRLDVGQLGDLAGRAVDRVLDVRLTAFLLDPAGDDLDQLGQHPLGELGVAADGEADHCRRPHQRNALRTFSKMPDRAARGSLPGPSEPSSRSASSRCSSSSLTGVISLRTRAGHLGRAAECRAGPGPDADRVAVLGAGLRRRPRCSPSRVGTGICAAEHRRGHRAARAASSGPVPRAEVRVALRPRPGRRDRRGDRRSRPRRRRRRFGSAGRLDPRRDSTS